MKSLFLIPVLLLLLAGCGPSDEQKRYDKQEIDEEKTEEIKSNIYELSN